MLFQNMPFPDLTANLGCLCRTAWLDRNGMCSVIAKREGGLPLIPTKRIPAISVCSLLYLKACILWTLGKDSGYFRQQHLCPASQHCCSTVWNRQILFWVEIENRFPYSQVRTLTAELWSPSPFSFLLMDA